MSETTGVIKQLSDMTPRERWSTEIKYAEKENKKFYDRAEAANKRYLDERDLTEIEAKKFNIFYANTNILESALYSQVPKPSVSRRYTDYRDQVARVAALVLERCLGQDLNDPADQFDATMRAAVQDRLVAGLGTAWLRLETETEDIPESEGGTLTDSTQSTSPAAQPGDEGFTVPATGGLPPAPLQKIKGQRVAVDYVYWKDFIFSPCRTWDERRWTGRRTYLTYDQLVKRFGKTKADLCSLNYDAKQASIDRTPGGTTPKHEAMMKAIVYEIWDRTTRKVFWYSDGYPGDVLDTKEDFLHLTSFEPCPTPMFANITTSNCVPRPDFFMIQDQYIELDTVNARISLLVSACKVVGVYPQNAKGIQDLLKGNENTMVPVENWAQFAEKGGVKGNIDWLPLDQIVTALQRLYEAREAIKGQIYELTGIADIVRGASKASETLGAQQIKAQFASVRIKKLQDEVARFASEILRIKAEIMVKHFEPDQLIRKSGIIYTDNDEWVADAIVLLKSEEGFMWRVTVQSDSMAQADYANEKKERIEFMSAISGFLGNALPMTQQVPETKPIIYSILKWGMSAFKQADDIEGMLDKQLSMMENKPPAPPPPDPKVQAAQMKMETDKQKAGLDAQKQQQDMANAQQKMGMEERMMNMEMGFKKQMNDMDMAMKQFELAMKQQEMRMKGQEHQQDLQFKTVEQEQNLTANAQEHEQDMQLSAAQGAQQIQLAEKTGQQQLKQGEAAGRQKLTLNAAAAKQKAAQKPKPNGAA